LWKGHLNVLTREGSVEPLKSAPVNSRRASFPDPKKRMRKSQ
jgi:hypothetical protein